MVGDEQVSGHPPPVCSPLPRKSGVEWTCNGTLMMRSQMPIDSDELFGRHLRGLNEIENEKLNSFCKQIIQWMFNQQPTHLLPPRLFKIRHFPNSKSTTKIYRPTWRVANFLLYFVSLGILKFVGKEMGRVRTKNENGNSIFRNGIYFFQYMVERLIDRVFKRSQKKFFILQVRAEKNVHS
jgi:hypothetical protein